VSALVGMPIEWHCEVHGAKTKITSPVFEIEVSGHLQVPEVLSLETRLST